MTIARSLTLTLSLIVLIDAPPLAAAQFDIDRQAASIAQQLQHLTHLIGRYTRLVEQYATLDCASQGMRAGAQVTPVGSTAVLCDSLNMVGGFQQSYRDLLAVPVALSDAGIEALDFWRNQIDDARTVTADTVRGAYADQTPAVIDAAEDHWNTRQADADRRIAFAHLRTDAERALLDTIAAAREATDDAAAEDTVSNTGIAQVRVAGTMTSGQLLVAVAQVKALQATEAAAAAYESEIGRRERDAVAAAERIAAAAALQTHLQAIEAQRANRQRGLELRLHPMYGGN